MTAKVMKSTKQGVCFKCLCPVAIGEEIIYAREFGVMHLLCPPDGIVEEHYGYVNLSPGRDTDDDWVIDVIHPDGAEGREGEEVEILTSKGNLKTEVLGEVAKVYEPRHVAYRKAPRPANNDPVTEVGVYETPDGEVFIVKQFTVKEGPDAGKEVIYARKLIEINAERALEEGGRVQIEFVKAPGAVYRLQAAWKMPLERAKELTIRYGRCLVCGRHLKAAKSVEDGIGPVCIKSFRGAQLAMSLRSDEPEETDEIEMPTPQLTQADIDAMDVAEIKAMIAKLQGLDS